VDYSDPKVYNHSAYQYAYGEVDESEKLSIRGSNVKESRLFSFSLNPLYPVTSFESRKLNLDYAKKEVLWYIKGDRFDLSICDIAGAWNDIVQPDGGINSNYGQTIFTGPCHYDWVIAELIRDKYSRRAVIVLGEPDKLKATNTDHRCTMYIVYHIRQNDKGVDELIQTVHMRSNDVIFGMTNDTFFFGLLHQFVWSDLVSFYPDLKLGNYIHVANSMHVYERHFNMLEDIIVKDDWYEIDIPIVEPGGKDLSCLRKCLDNTSDFYRWLKD